MTDKRSCSEKRVIAWALIQHFSTLFSNIVGHVFQVNDTELQVVWILLQNGFMPKCVKDIPSKCHWPITFTSVYLRILALGAYKLYKHCQVRPLSGCPDITWGLQTAVDICWKKKSPIFLYLLGFCKKQWRLFSGKREMFKKISPLIWFSINILLYFLPIVYF